MAAVICRRSSSPRASAVSGLAAYRWNLNACVLARAELLGAVQPLDAREPTYLIEKVVASIP